MTYLHAQCTKLLNLAASTVLKNSSYSVCLTRSPTLIFPNFRMFGIAVIARQAGKSKMYKKKKCTKKKKKLLFLQKEVVSALPKLIKLNPVVVKEVFNRLLGGHGDDSYSSPLSPADLLVTLHNIDPQKCDMKTIIKGESLWGWWLRVLTH